MINIIGLPSMIDNIIWVLHNDTTCIIVDPGTSKIVLKFVKRLKLSISGIFLTHYHHDHIDGTLDIIEHYSNVPIFCSSEVKFKKVKIVKVMHGDQIHLMDMIFNVISLPGHTMYHIGFYSYPILFCGDVIFSAGCGRIFEGTYKMMLNSIKKIKNLPMNTIIFPAHEYTVKNLLFASQILPKDKFIQSYIKIINKFLLKELTILPTTLFIEYQVNVFFRCNDQNLKKSLKLNVSEYKLFKILRIMRDNF